MKKKHLKLVLAISGLVLLTFACIKKIDPPKGGGNDGGDGGNNNSPCKYENLAKGTIEACPQDSNLWFINANIGGQTGPMPVYTKLFFPINLPKAFKKNGFPVSFSFKYLPDSVKLDCWFCGTPPAPYARKIQVCNMKQDSMQIIIMKPVIYLYPKKESKVKVELNFQGKLTVTYPDYSEKLRGWEVLAKKDGSLKNLSDNTEHQYLFWEGTPSQPYNFNMLDGYCVKGTDTKTFLQNILPKLGLTPKEYNDMIVFWLPKMMNNNYNIIHFAGTDYSQSAPLTISPSPDQVIRVFMAYQPSKTFVKTSEPVIVTPKRKGFTVVEWGGVEMPETLPQNTENL